MKRFLRVGERYVLSKHKLKQYKIRYISLVAVLTTMCLYARGQRPTRIWSGRPLGIIVFIFLALGLEANAQFYKPSEKTIRMGEALPESFYQTTHQAINASTGRSTAIKLADYQNKLIILDFWATWCGPCIYSLNKLDSIGKAAKDERYVVIPVTNQREREISGFLRNSTWDLTTIVRDTVLAQVFPHAGIPHQVWIREGKVIAFPEWRFATYDNIVAVINGETPYMAMNIQDLMLDPDEPMFVEGNGKTGLWYSHHHAKLSRHVPDYRRENLTFYKKRDTTILYLNNQPIEQLFYQAYKDEIFPNLDWKEGSGIRWEISKGLHNRLFANRPKPPQVISRKDDSLYLEWQNRNLYGYELRYPEAISEAEAKYVMQQDLNRFFNTYLGLTAKIEEGPTLRYPVLKLSVPREEAERRLSELNLVKDDYSDFSGREYWVLALSLTGSLQNAGHLNLSSAMVDSTGIDPRLPINVHYPKALKRGSTLEDINEFLANYGLKVDTVERPVPVLVIRGGEDGSNQS